MILITGGTGSLGKKICEYISKYYDVIIFSRDEKKQAELKQKHPDYKYEIGDIRDLDRVKELFEKYKIDIIYHTAALKHVDLGESFVNEFMLTNYVGTKNLVDCALRYNANQFVFFTTDKAVCPINAYGASKMLAEKYLFAKCFKNSKCKLQVFRWGNIIGSRGSFLENLVCKLKSGSVIPVTNLNMTRFWLTLDDVVGFVFECWESSNKRNVIIPDCITASSIKDFIRIVNKIVNDSKEFEYKEIGIRPGEKIHELLKFEESENYCGGIIESSNIEYHDLGLLEKKLRSVLKK